MVNINNSDLKKELKINIITDAVPTELGKTVVPVMEINPKLLRVCNIIEGTTLIGPTTFYTTPANKDFYLTNAWITLTAGDGGSTRSITCVLNNVTKTLLNAYATHTWVDDGGNSNNSNLNCTTPIKLDRNSAVIATGTSGGGSGAVGIIGYTVED